MKYHPQEILIISYYLEKTTEIWVEMCLVKGSSGYILIFTIP